MYEFYKIKHPTEELYSSGLKYGSVQTTKKGKTWNALGHIKSHLIQVERHDPWSLKDFYNNWVVIKITENGVETLGTIKEFKL